MKIGYARVSTDAQDYSAQVDALRAAGAEKIVSEKITGASLDRRSLRGLIERLGAGGTSCLSREWTGSLGALAIFSTRSMRSVGLVPRSRF
jgi:hypothetical protein